MKKMHVYIGIQQNLHITVYFASILISSNETNVFTIKLVTDREI